ncbi:MAG: selenide, water dikinase SelD [Deltaproteobacteria bacterium]|nr:selenide, water dikinase SelD [Candidatus Tharpella sp.]
MADVLRGLSLPVDERLLVGIEGADDAGVFRLDDQRALVQTVDFFPPMVDDPYRFGQIAAANAFSDVYAMGGIPLTAMNLVAFPINCLEPAILHNILAGGLDKIKEAGAVLAGGHSIDDPEIKYGLSVTGEVHPEHIWRNQGARAGDVLLLTKPLGNGVLATALKADFVTEEEISQTLAWMAKLNVLPPEESNEAWRQTVHACTDVTGFGFFGHLCEMISEDKIGALIELNHVPLLERAEEFCSMGLFPEGGHRNRDHFGYRLQGKDLADPILCDLLFDPQTSGGLLLAIAADKTETVIRAFNTAGTGCWPVGRFTDNNPGRIMII